MHFSGIPCRSVTNYVSAHDTNRTFTVDKYFDRDGNEVPNGPDEDCYDSCWNFHVWNDVWMQRPDLPQGLKSYYTLKVYIEQRTTKLNIPIYFLQDTAAGKLLMLPHRKNPRRYIIADLLALRLYAVARSDSNTTRPSCIASSTLNYATSKRKKIRNGASLEWPRISISK